MDILAQCQKYHENEEYQKIVDALESVPGGERTPEMDSELARAYNNLSHSCELNGREMLKKALALLEPHEELLKEEHCWNFRMGYSYYYLDQPGRALTYFQKALESRADDADTQEVIDSCKSLVSFPQFEACFRERVENGWKVFAEREEELRRMMEAGKAYDRREEIINQTESVLHLVFDEIAFEMGFNGEKYELILSPEGDKVKLFELVYFRKHAPEEVLRYWNILVGRQPLNHIGLCTDDGWEISGEDIQVWVEDLEEESFAISLFTVKSYCQWSRRMETGRGGFLRLSWTRCWERFDT